VWERTQKTSHFQQHFKLIFKLVFTLSFHYKRKHKKVLLRVPTLSKNVGTPFAPHYTTGVTVVSVANSLGGDCPGDSFPEGSCSGGSCPDGLQDPVR